ncbi:hypothetical protein B9Z55_007931 [Caenorhabditis nigoni]|uniref:BTB domain-containing protein n=1 Tax=Caenorhabditis nigoni TaxID=1611254 RepID=A0A2G5VBW8_9PELO|nr:hypothetical protein B9Z55_007931 [Caenorhabditis nigoni]
MSDNKGKQFSISQEFKNWSSLKNDRWIYGAIEEHFGTKWKIQLDKYPNGSALPYLSCESSETGNWSINTACDLIVDGKSIGTGLRFKFNGNSKACSSGYFINNDFRERRNDESFTIEFQVKITEMTGIEENKSRSFDDDVAKKSSDVVLVVGDKKFYVSKLLLTFHSTYFESLFSESFSESGKSEIELKDIDPEGFQNFLELIYGMSLVDDDTVSGILKLADFFDAKTAIQRCEDFLLTGSEKSIKDKFEMANKYKLENLKKKCISGLKTGSEFRSIIPENANEIDNNTWKELLSKSASLL